MALGFRAKEGGLQGLTLRPRDLEGGGAQGEEKEGADRWMVCFTWDSKAAPSEGGVHSDQRFTLQSGWKGAQTEQQRRK